MQNTDELLKRAYTVKVANEDRVNTALRIGSLFVDIIRSNEDIQQTLEDYSEEVKSWRWLRYRRGEWNLGTAKGVDPYRFYERNRINEKGEQYNQTVQHTVFRYGCEWGCLTDMTTNPPEWKCRDWMLIDGQDAYYLDFLSSKGFQFFKSQVDTVITAEVFHKGKNITNLAMAAADTVVAWERITGNDAEDRSWRPDFPGEEKNIIHLKLADMGSGWGKRYRIVTFICTVYLQIGETEVPVVNEINYKM